MSGGDDLSTLGGKITDVFVKTFASADPSAGLVFLSLGVALPKEIVQPKSDVDPTPVINPAQMAAFLAQHFDEPYLVSSGPYGVGGRDGYYGRFSQIYPLAVSLAQPSSAVGTPGWKLVNSEIAASQAALTPAGMAYAMGCIPIDWALPSNSGYWSVFDSTQVQGPPPADVKTLTPVSRNVSLWAFRTSAAAVAPVHELDEIHAANPPQVISPKVVEAARVSPNIGAIALKRNIALAAAPTLTMQAATAPVTSRAAPSVAQATVINPKILERSVALSERPVGLNERSVVLNEGWRQTPRKIYPFPPPSPPPPPPPPAPSASVTMHFEYMSVDIGYFNAGLPIWNAMFIANPDWSVPGMTRGGLLPAPHIGSASDDSALAYGLPISLVLVRNLNISIKWSGQAPSGFDSGNGGAIGPFSLAGASITDLPDGAWSCSQPGVQVVATVCRRLPVLPPRDDPAIAATTAANVPNSGSGTTAPNGSSGDPPDAPPASGQANASGAPSTDNSGGAPRSDPAAGGAG